MGQSFKRKVFYIPGYDPIHPRRYRELYRTESAAQAAISGYDIHLTGKTVPGGYGWFVDSEIDGRSTRADFEVMIWSDLVRASMRSGILETYAQMLRTAYIYIASGTLWRLMHLRKGPVIAALYPVVMLIGQAGVALAAGTAPNDLATKIMTTKDPMTGQRFSASEMVDQVAIFFLAGHETSASALSWALYLMATHPEYQDKVAREGEALGPQARFEDLRRLAITRDVFRETLRLYPLVPMMVREAAQAETFRGRDVAPGSQVVLSPWHLHRHMRLWDNPDGFDPERWHSENGKHCQRAAFIPFSAGPRVCTGAGFAMLEGVLLLARLCAAYEFLPIAERVPQPVAHLTVRSDRGIWLKLRPRGT